MNETLSKAIVLELSGAHLLVVWDVLANRLSQSAIKAHSKEEQRALWALQDLCESKLEASGLFGRAEVEWDALMLSEREQVKKLPVEFLD